MKKSFYIVLALGNIMGALVGASFQEHVMRPKIIENGAGHYDQISGEFQWGAPEKTIKQANNDAATDIRTKPGVDNALKKALGG